LENDLNADVKELVTRINGVWDALGDAIPHHTAPPVEPVQ
jgi:hypothetical protein